MEIPINPELLNPSRLGREITLLSKLEVPPRLIGHLFNVTPNNLRQIRLRTKNARPAALEALPLSEWHRGKPEYASKGGEAEDLQIRLSDIFYHARHDGAFEAGIEQLKAELPTIGNLKDVHRRRAFALIHEYVAWFYVHLGQSQKSYAHGVLAIDQHLRANTWNAGKDAGSPDLRRHIKSGLIVALALRKLRLTREAVRTLQDLNKFIAAGKFEKGSEHHRQFGSIYLPFHPEAARVHYEQARVAHSKNLRNEDFPLAERLIANREVNFIDGDYDEQRRLLAELTDVYPREHMQVSVNTLWTAACLLLASDSDLDWEAIDLLSSPGAAKLRPSTRQLLLMTPALNLRKEARRQWLVAALSCPY